MFDIEILGYSFCHEHDKSKYPVVEIEARYEDNFLGMPIEFERVYDAYDWVYHRLDGTLDDMIKNFVDELWKEFHKGIPKAYEISLYISLPVGLNMWIKEHIRNEFEKRLAIKRDEDKFYRALSNMKFGLGIEPNRDIRTLLPESCYIDTDLADSISEDKPIAFYDVEVFPNLFVLCYKMPGLKTQKLINPNPDMDTCRYTKEIAKDRAKAKEKIKEYENMKIEDVIFNDPATIVFWRDGSKTVVKAQNEPFDKEKGLAMAIAKKVYGNEGNYYNEFKKFIKDEPKEEVIMFDIRIEEVNYYYNLKCEGEFGDIINFEHYVEKIKEYEKMKIENVIFNDPATIVFWRDGSKTVVKAKDEPFDPEKGLAMAIAKKVYGNEGNYYNEFKKFIKDEPKEDNKNE